jgi:hypothetical protein
MPTASCSAFGSSFWWSQFESWLISSVTDSVMQQPARDVNYSSLPLHKLKQWSLHNPLSLQSYHTRDINTKMLKSNYY